jgi:uncharacterized membrane protein required for colicin V production
MMTIGVILVILVVAFWQSVQGLFSAVTLTVLAILSAVIAFNFFEPLGNVLVERQGAYAQPIAMLALFAAALLALRLIFDRLAPGAFHVSPWADRIGGALVGVIAGLVMSGMLVIIVSLLPLGAEEYGYQPYDSALAPADGGPPRWSSHFVLGMMEGLSAGALAPIGEGNKLMTVHDDLLLEAYALRNRPPGASSSAKPGAVEVTNAYKVVEPEKKETLTAEELARQRILYPLPKADNMDIVIVRTVVRDFACDEDNWYRLPATHFRLVAKVKDDKGDEVNRSYYPVAYLTYAGAWRVNAVQDGNRLLVGDLEVDRPAKPREIDAEKPATNPAPSKLVVDWVYCLPAGAQLKSMVFRRTDAWSLDAFQPRPGLPEHLTKDGVGPLSVKPTPEKSAFLQLGQRVITPDLISHLTALPAQLRVGVGGATSLPALSQAVANATGTGIIKLQIEGAELEQLAKIPAGAKAVGDFAVPSDKFKLLAVHAKVAAGAEAKFLEQMQPQLLFYPPLPVTTAPAMGGHNGAYVIYSKDGKKYIYAYYDAGKTRDNLPAELAKILTDKGVTIEDFALLFDVVTGVPWDVAGLSLCPNLPEKRSLYEFFAVQPIALGK